MNCVSALAGMFLAFAFAGAAAGSECGTAAWYKDGEPTASGERTADGSFTAAHPTLPFGTLVKVENVTNGKSTIVRINDRGRFVKGRIINVSHSAAEQLGLIETGVASVEVTAVGGTNPLPGSCLENIAAKPRERHSNSPNLSRRASG